MKQLADLALKHNNDHSPPDSDEEDEDNHDNRHHDTVALTHVEEEDNTTPHVSKMKHLVIELEREDEFFYALTTELEQAAELQNSTTHKFEEDVRELEYRMVAVVRKYTAPLFFKVEFMLICMIVLFFFLPSRLRSTNRTCTHGALSLACIWTPKYLEARPSVTEPCGLWNSRGHSSRGSASSSLSKSYWPN